MMSTRIDAAGSVAVQKIMSENPAIALSQLKSTRHKGMLAG
jgi:hypothetical protein